MKRHEELLKNIKSDCYQYAAYQYEGSGVVKAGPGSGKTTVITMKIKKLISEIINHPRGLACITYSNATANHFSSKLKEIGVHVEKNVVLSTVHSFCLKQVLIPFGHLNKSKISFPLKILSDKERESILNKVLVNKGILEISLNDFDILRSRYHSPINQDKKLTESEKLAIEDYEGILISNGYCDLPLIVRDALKAISENEYIRKSLEAKFPWILVDEYQDLGQSLHEIVLILSEKTNINFFVVGDPDQSIYSFQGGNPDFFYQLYDNPSFKRFELKRNYRTTQYLIDTTLSALDMDNREYESGIDNNHESNITFVECEENMISQYMYLVNNLIPELKTNEVEFEEICILAATNRQISELANVFSVNDIPFFIEGAYYWKLNTAKWIIKCVNYMQHEISFQELYSSYEQLILSKEKTDEPYFKLFKILEDSKAYQNNLFKWYTFVNAKVGFEKLLITPELASEKILFERFKDDFLTREYSLKEMCIETDSSNKITISTRHSSKGLEFGVIILLGMEDGSFPYYLYKKDSKEYREQERVFFVSLTRAKYYCYLIRSKYVSGISKQGNPYKYEKKPSVFWEELYKKIHDEN